MAAGWSKDKRPARANYWAKRSLVKNKVRRMRKAYGLSEKAAMDRWHAERKGRVAKGIISDVTQGKACTHNKKKKVQKKGESNVEVSPKQTA